MQSLFSVPGFASTLIVEKVTKPHWLIVIKEFYIQWKILFYLTLIASFYR